MNISALFDDTHGYDGRVRTGEIDKGFMQRFLSHVACVHAIIMKYDGTVEDQTMVGCFVRIVASDLMDIAHAYGVDMSKAAERGTKRNIERGRISEEE